MLIWECMKIAIDSLIANKVRSALTVLGVLIGVAAVIAMVAIAKGAEKEQLELVNAFGSNTLMVFAGQARRGIVATGTAQRNLTLDDVEAILRKCSMVVRVSPEVRRAMPVRYGNRNTFTTVVGVTPDYLTVANWSVDSGRFITEADLNGMRKVCVLGKTVIANLFGEEPPLGKMIRIQGVQFEVVGTLTEKGALRFMDFDDQILIPITTAMRRLFGIDYVTAIGVQAPSMELLPLAQQQVTELLRKRHRINQDSQDDFTVRSQSEFMQMAQSTSQMFLILLASIASVSLLVGGIGIMNIMLVSVAERTREIGIRKAVGARRRDILLQFLVEAVVLTVIGGAIGILFGVGTAKAIGKAAGWTVVIPPYSIALAFFFAISVGLFFGIYPAYKAASLDPIEALRHE
ncbi:MAG: ABC transporter permease [Armatimonadota bacterium]|nr:ABC transporter permease [Armatimonadota bacterium]MCX7776782.1 ABC transporter permease [Armatimonadota bacterium]MDW8024579.1 ABC transporter permease [Armatimonadota bacterium]